MGTRFDEDELKALRPPPRHGQQKSGQSRVANSPNPPLWSSSHANFDCVRPKFFALAALVCVALVAGAVPAVAQSLTAADPADDVTGVPYIDARSMSIKNTKKSLKITIAERASWQHQGGDVTYLDTNPRLRGPELAIRHDKFHWTVTPMRRWKTDRRTAVARKWGDWWDGEGQGKCSKALRIKGTTAGAVSKVTLTIPKRKGCVTGKRARVHHQAKTIGYADDAGLGSWPTSVTDHFPNGARKFTRWVKQRSRGAKPVKFTDGHDPLRAWTDILSSRIDHTSSRLDVTVRHRPKPIGRLGGVTTYLDTNADSIPNWKVVVTDSGEGMYLSRVSGWDDYGVEQPCSFTNSPAANGGVTSFSLPTSCIGTPKSLRVSIKAEDISWGAYRPMDWWLGLRKWSGPLSRASTM